MKIRYELITKQFYGWKCDDVVAIAENVLSRMDQTDEDELYQCMCDELIYTDDKWSLIEYYCTPENCSFDEAWALFHEDLLRLISNGVFEG